MITADQKQANFYREFLMGRGSFDPRDFGVEMDRTSFMDLMVDEFNSKYHTLWTVDELLLHPREASRFCDEVRSKHRCFEVPDDIILRSIITRRKNPNG